MYDLLSSELLFNYTVILNITSNSDILGYEIKNIEDYNFFNCDIDTINNDVNCESFSIWSPYEDNGFSASWQSTILQKYSTGSMIFNTSIILYNIGTYLQKYGNFSIYYIYENEEYVTIEFYIKCGLCVLTILILIIWIYFGLSDSKTQKDLIAEQRWMIVLFFAVLLYQDPLSISLFASSSQPIYLISSIFFATSINLFMIYWSLMIDSIREIKNMLDIGVTFGCKFYRGKLISVFFSYASSLIFTICTQYLIENNETNASYNTYFLENFNDALVLSVLISGVIWFLCVLSFIIWLFSSLWNANKELNKLPYIETRERQLSLRMFKHFTFCVICIIIIVQIYNVYKSDSPLYLVDARRTNLSSLFVITIYVYCIAFLYLPSTNKNIIQSQHDFQLSNAIILCHLSWQSYLTPKWMPKGVQKHPSIDDNPLIIEQIPKSKWGTINLSQFNLNLIDFITNEKHDTQIIIAHGHLHKIFKQQRNIANDKYFRSKSHRRSRLLLAPRLLRSKTKLYGYQHKFLDDVSSDTQSDDDNDDDDDNKQDDEKHDNKIEEEEKGQSMIGAIKDLLTFHETFTFKIKKSSNSKNTKNRNKNSNNKSKSPPLIYGSLEERSRHQSIDGSKSVNFMGVDSSKVNNNNDNDDKSNNNQPILRKALSLFIKSPQNQTKNNNSIKQPLLPSYNNNSKSKSELTTISAPLLTKHKNEPPLNNNNNDNDNDDNDIPEPSPLIFNEYPPMQHNDDNKYSAPDLSELSIIHMIDKSLTPKEEEKKVDIQTVGLNDNMMRDHSYTLHNDYNNTDQDRNMRIKNRATTLTSHQQHKRKHSKKHQNKHKNKNKKNGFHIPILSNLIPISNDLLNPKQIKKHKKYIDIIIGFRGTDSSVNVKLDLKFARTAIDPTFWYGDGLSKSLTDNMLWKKCVRPNIIGKGTSNPLNLPTMKVHRGFFEAFQTIYQQLFQTILTTYHRILYKKKREARFYITGHSLGGALAQLCGLYLEILFGHRSTINIYVYGCPRVGDRQFSAVLSGRVKHMYRVVFRGDIMTTVPRGLGYYKHAGYEIIIDPIGNMINNPTKREKALLPSRTSLKDHGLQNYINSLNSIAKKYKLQHLALKLSKS